MKNKDVVFCSGVFSLFGMLVAGILAESYFAPRMKQTLDALDQANKEIVGWMEIYKDAEERIGTLLEDRKK